MAVRRTAHVAGATLALSLSLAGPQALGVAVADTDQADTTHRSTAESARSALEAPHRTQSAPEAPRQAPSAAPTRPASARRNAESGSRSAHRAPANPAASIRRSAELPSASRPVVSVPAADSGQRSTVAVDPLPRPANASVIESAAPTAAVADGSLPTAVAAPQALTAAGPAQQVLNTIGQLLTNLPATPLTDVLTGSLWLVRRALTAIETAVGSWGPTACACAPSGDVVGQVLTVTNSVDGAPGSLRDVLATASDGDVIRFAPTLRHANLLLTEGELDVDASVRIEGSGQILDADSMSRIMRLDQPGTSIALSGLTFANGTAPGDPTLATAGGAILADGVALQICGVTFTGNSAISAGAASPESGFTQYGLGGAIAAFASTLSIHDSAFVGNTATGADNDSQQQPSGALGGAIFAEESEITLLRSQFTGNAAFGGSGVTPIETVPSAEGGWAAGGAVYTTRAALTATEVTFTGNSVTGGDGLDGSAEHPYGNDVGSGGSGSGGALWIQGNGQGSEDVVALNLNRVVFQNNIATGGSAGSQGSALLAGQQGGRGIGGALGAVDWVAITLADVTVADNLAQGGGVGPNAPDSGANTGTGGVGQGGGAFLESPASVDAVRLSVRDNTARGGRGADSAPDSGTEAGEGGYAYGGGIFLTNGTGGLYEPAVIPVGIRDTEIVGNRAVGGEKGDGPVPDGGLGAGGLAQSGGLDMISLFSSQLVGVRFIGNTAIAGQGKFAAGGALSNPFGAPPEGVDANLLILNSFFRANSAIGGDDAANPVYRRSEAGAFLHNGSGTVISGSRFEGNSVIGGNDTGSGHVGSATGGAISNVGGDPIITIFDTAFVDNAVLGGRRVAAGESLIEPDSGEARGGAISSEGGTVSINGGSFVGNRAVDRSDGHRVASGGAIDIPVPFEGYVGYLETTAVRFAHNSATSPTGQARGGAVAFNGNGYTDNGSFFIGNTVRSGHHEGSAAGGALFLEQTSRLTGTTVVLNRARGNQGFGGGIALPNGPEVLTPTLTTIGWNRATTAGDDVWWPSQAT